VRLHGPETHGRSLSHVTGVQGEVEVGTVAAQQRSDVADGSFTSGTPKQQQQLCPGCSTKSALVG